MTASSSSTSPMSQHEQVVFCHDEATGLRAIIAIYSTALGPAPRRHPLLPVRLRAGQALADVLRLSAGMAYKNAVAGLDLGGGKAVIIGDPQRDKTPELLRAYGRFVESLGGRYVTACDVGTYVADMDVVARDHPLGHRPLARGERRRRRLLGAHRLRRLPGHARRRPARVGRADPRGAHRSASPASARSGACSTGHLLEDGAERRRHRRQHGCRGATSVRVHPQVRGRRRHRDAGAPDSRRLRPLRPRRRARRRDRRGPDARRSSAAAPTTSSSTRARAAPPTASGARHHLRPRLPRQRRRRHPGQRRAARVRHSSAPASAPRPSSSTPSRCCATPTTAGGAAPPLAADRLAERRIAAGASAAASWLPGDRVSRARRPLRGARGEHGDARHR